MPSHIDIKNSPSESSEDERHYELIRDPVGNNDETELTDLVANAISATRESIGRNSMHSSDKSNRKSKRAENEVLGIEAGMFSPDASPLTPFSQFMHPQRLDPGPPKLTRVNGIGLWRSWTRNFKSPILALLDLVDNAFDACFANPVEPPFGGKILIMPDIYSGLINNDKSLLAMEKSAPPSTKTTTTMTIPMSKATTTGIVIVNNSAKEIKSLHEILEVYSSKKGKSSETIGENGVGLKQGCANLSDLSFVLVRNEKKLSLGVIASELQKPEGCYLPAFDLLEENGRNTLLEQIATICMDTDKKIGRCVASYGGGDLGVGINRLCGHFRQMTQGNTWKPESYVFCVILHKIRHKRRISVVDCPIKGEEKQLEGLSQVNIAMVDEDEYGAKALSLMEEIKRELPRQYIHIPRNFDVRVGDSLVRFHYWQRRMVEFSRFDVQISIDEHWRDTLRTKSSFSGYNPRIFIGFDVLRLGGTQKSSPLSLFVYSRQSGRLIKHEPDARGLLDLNASGSDFCQGLTVIFDDFEGNLPLNPTKQDVAFSEQENGEIHRRNLMSWLSATAYSYFHFHLKNANKKKATLTRAVLNFYDDASKLYKDDYFQDEMIHMKLLENSILTTFSQIEWKNSSGRLRSTGLGKYRVGTDTYFRFRVTKKARKNNDATEIVTSCVGKEEPRKFEKQDCDYDEDEDLLEVGDGYDGDPLYDPIMTDRLLKKRKYGHSNDAIKTLSHAKSSSSTLNRASKSVKSVSEYQKVNDIYDKKESELTDEISILQKTQLTLQTENNTLRTNEKNLKETNSTLIQELKVSHVLQSNLKIALQAEKNSKCEQMKNLNHLRKKAYELQQMLLSGANPSVDKLMPF